jgi:hypothetical protein
MNITSYILSISMMIISLGTLSAASPDKVSKSTEITKASNLLEMALHTLNNVLKDPGNGIPKSLVDQ